MKSFNLGKHVKKLIGQKKSLKDITILCNSSMEECANAYESYTGKKIFAVFYVVGNQKQKIEIRKLILQRQKILLFGDIGVGKSSVPKLIADELGYRIVTSFPRKNEDLLKDFAQLPLETKNTIFVLEGDSFYWRTYALINHYLRESKCPFIIIVSKKDTVPKRVQKHLVAIKLYPPTQQDVEAFVRKRYPEWNGNIKDVYDKDLRITLRKIRYGITSYKPQPIEKFDAQKVAYLILQGKAKRNDINNMSHPQLFLLNWLGNNAHKFYSNLQKFDDISFVDTYKYNFKRKYLDGVLLNLGRADKRAKMKFPSIKYKVKKEQEEKWEKKKLRKKMKPTPKPEPQKTIIDFGADMIL